MKYSVKQNSPTGIFLRNICIFLAIITLSIISISISGCSNSDTSEQETYIPESSCIEHSNVQLSVQVMMHSAKPPITNLATDDRIIDYSGTLTKATNDMTNGGLISVNTSSINGGAVNPPNYYLQHIETKWEYFVSANGTVHQVINGAVSDDEPCIDEHYYGGGTKVVLPLPLKIVIPIAVFLSLALALTLYLWHRNKTKYRTLSVIVLCCVIIVAVILFIVNIDTSRYI